MKIKFGFRSVVILLFLVIYLFSLFFINNILSTQQNNIQKAYSDLEINEKFKKLNFKTFEDSLLAENILTQFGEIKGSTNLIISNAKMSSIIFLLVTMTIAVLIFVLFLNRLTAPLREMQQATERIGDGEFSVHLSETGIFEMKSLKQSFNQMSQELENTQTKLLEAEKQVIWKEISRVLAHEIKNPLTPIQLSIQRLEEKYYSDEKSFFNIFPETAKLVYNEVDNLRKLVQEFSEFAKITSPKTETFSPKNYLSEILSPYKHSINLSIDIPENMLIDFDKLHFYQIITNIIQNAIDAISGVDNGQVMISLSQSRNFFVLIFSDNGVGIEKQDIGRVFDPYFSKKKKGTGLGLALVKRLVTSNQSFIRVKSEIKKGTSFELIIPQKIKS